MKYRIFEGVMLEHSDLQCGMTCKMMQIDEIEARSHEEAYQVACLKHNKTALTVDDGKEKYEFYGIEG